jgi:hypothetical protein
LAEEVRLDNAFLTLILETQQPAFGNRLSDQIKNHVTPFSAGHHPGSGMGLLRPYPHCVRFARVKP